MAVNPDNKYLKGYITHKSGAAGGLLVGKRHSEGGIKVVNNSDNSPLEVEGGEVIITRPAVADNTKREFEGQMMTNREILSKINSDAGGVAFAEGGAIPDHISTKGNSYKYGGKVMRDYEIVADCGCKHKMKKGGNLIKRADGHYSQHGLWDSIRENAGSGKKPTKEMLKQEKKILAKQNKYKKYDAGGNVSTGHPYLDELVKEYFEFKELRDKEVNGDPLLYMKYERAMRSAAQSAADYAKRRMIPDPLDVTNDVYDEGGEIEWDEKYNAVSDQTGFTEFDYNESGKTIAVAKEIAPRLLVLKDFILSKLYENGWDNVDATTAKTGSIYIHLHGLGAGATIRISDHSGRGGIFSTPYNVYTLSDAKDAITKIGTKENSDRIEREMRAKSEEESKINTQLRSKIDERLKSEGYTFGKNSRTYQNPTEFMSKHPDYKNIRVQNLGANNYGEQAYQYQWVRPYDSKYELYVSPDMDYIKWYETQSFKNGGKVDIGKLSKGMTLEDVANLHGMKESELKDELKMGIKHEMSEHTNDKMIAMRIALDHLVENPYYYTQMKKFEEQDTTDYDSHFEEIVVKMADGGEIAPLYSFTTPTGATSKLNYIQQVLVRTKAFKEYFGDWELAAKKMNLDNADDAFVRNYEGVSKVIDFETLEPQVVYHGTVAQEEFFAFDVTKEEGVGRPYAYFAINKDYAQNFTQFSQRGQNAVSLLYSAFLNIKKPFMAKGANYDHQRQMGSYWRNAIINTIAGDLCIEQNTEKYSDLSEAVLSQIKNYTTETYTTDAPFWWLMARDTNKEFKFFLMSYGYDGVVYSEEFTTVYDVSKPNEFTFAYTVFDARQIKLADGRNVDFNPMNPDIRYEKGGKIENTEKMENREETNEERRKRIREICLTSSKAQNFKSGGEINNDKDNLITFDRSNKRAAAVEYVDNLIARTKN